MDCDTCRAHSAARRVADLIDAQDNVRGAEWQCTACGDIIETIDTPKGA